MEEKYDFGAVENKWIERWERDGIYRTVEEPGREKKYVLVMFPYPSGPAHMGHVANYNLGDLLARYYRRRGFNVLHPMGWDGFGLPAENAAIKSGVHPAVYTWNNIDLLRSDLKRLGYSYDWQRELATCAPDYYRWTQWFFLKFYEKGLAYKSQAKANWCPSCRTVLANEQVVDGHCERCESVVEKRLIDQWLLRITDYAERLLEDTSKLRGLARAGHHHAEELDRPVRGLRGRPSAWSSWTSPSPSTPPGPTPCGASPSSSWPPSTPWSTGWWRAPRSRPAWTPSGSASGA